MNRVKELRLEKGLSQNDVAIAAQITPKHVSFIENGERTPSLKVAQKIAVFFEVPIEEIFLQKNSTFCTSKN